METRFIRVKVHAGAREDRIRAKGADAFEVWVRAPAERGRANASVLALVAGALGTEAKRLRIVKGATSPSKILLQNL